MILPIKIMAVLSGTSASTPRQCATNGRVTEAIAGLVTERSGLADRLSILAGDPVVAACQLVASLHVVRDTHVAGYQQGQRRNAMRVVWAIRALRYLTGCQDFRAPTRENPATWSALRRDFLLRGDSAGSVRNWTPADGVPFFQTWMSCDSVFIAPRDAQRKIIARWHTWYRESGSRGVGFRTCESMDQWYF